jgi:hypothetical protein
MPDFRLRDPDGNEHVTGDGSERARLLGQGYTDTDDDRDDSGAGGVLAAPDTDRDTAASSKPVTAKPPTQTGERK